jgi:chromosomal replication initiator protein
METKRPLTLARLVPVPEIRPALIAVQRLAAGLASGRPVRSGNPLYLHGPSGTGKTYLISALVGEITRRSPQTAVTILAARDLNLSARDMDEADPIQASRSADLLVVEDLQYLSARGAEAWVRLFDDLDARQVPVVVTASVGPRHLDLPARLTSRLAGGLVVRLEPFGVASRLALLEDKAQRRQVAVSRDVLAWLAERLAGGRQIDGALARLETLARVHRGRLDMATVAEHFQEEAAAGRPTVEHIARHVGSHFRVEPRQLQSGRRFRQVLVPRQIGMYLARQLTELSLDQIGAYFGGRDHSTVLHACRKVEQALDQDAALASTVQQLRSTLTG